MGNDLLEGKVALSSATQKMRKEMDRAWKDFFEKNPNKKEKDVWRWVEERLRSKENSEGQDEGV